MAMRTAIPALLTVFLALAPQLHAQPRYAACHCGPAAKTAGPRDLHRPSADAERAETARLNREYLAAATARPAMREARNPAPYRSELDQYRQLRDGYDRRLRDYYRAVPPPRAYARMQPPPSPGNEIGLQDRNRFDPWHGYNPGAANGY